MRSFPGTVLLTSTLCVAYPVLASDITRHELNSCNAERGLAQYSFSVGAVEKKVISDVCVDREKGTVTAIEDIESFEIVRRQDGAERFERLIEAGDAAQKTNMQIAPSISTWSFYDVEEIVSPELAILTNFQGGPAIKNFSSDSYFARGYLIGEQPAMEAFQRTYPIVITAFAYRKSKADLDGHRKQVPPMVFDGELVFESQAGGAQVEDNSDYAPDMGDGSGEFRFSADNTGKLTVTGSFETANSRLAGFSPGEWKTSSCTFENIHGHILGQDGNLVRAIGLGDCQLIDIDGKEGNLSMQIFIEGFSEK